MTVECEEKRQMPWWSRFQGQPFYPGVEAVPVVSLPDRPAKPDDGELLRPVNPPWSPGGGLRYWLMMCRVSGVIPVQQVLWMGRDQEHAEKTFAAWLDQPWVLLNRDFDPGYDGGHGRFMFRPLAICGFEALLWLPWERRR